MSASTFDTLVATDALRAAGLEDAPARAIVNTVRAAVGEQAATKTDLAALIADFAALKADFAALKADFAALESRFDAKLASAVNKMLLAQIAVGTLIVALVKLL